jgi:hypothetical protein
MSSKKNLLVFFLFIISIHVVQGDLFIPRMGGAEGTSKSKKSVANIGLDTLLTLFR